MTAEWATALGTIGTFVVIAASAVAALLQLRHMRSGNQISAFNELRETMESAEFRSALHFIRMELPARLRDPSLVSHIAMNNFPDEYAGIRIAANLYENLGLFVRLGIMDRFIACAMYYYLVLEAWDKLRPLTAELRSKFDSSIWINFEYLAAISQEFKNKGRGSGFPPGIGRMRLDEEGQKYR